MIGSRSMKWAGYGTLVGKESNMYRLFVRKPEGRRPVRRTKRGWWIILRLISDTM
jgi:hypothetical protein